MWNLIFAAPVSPQPQWTWEATATIIQAIATIVALAGVAVTFYYSLRAERREHARTQAEARRAAEENRRAREEAERSEASAERAERAAALSIDTMARIAEAVEALAKSDGFPSAIPSTEPKRVRWSLEHFDGDRYILTNVGNAPAYGVKVRVDPTLRIAGGIPEPDVMQPDDNFTFLALVMMGTRDTTIAVEWADDSDPDARRETWRYPLPPRGPRN